MSEWVIDPIQDPDDGGDKYLSVPQAAGPLGDPGSVESTHLDDHLWVYAGGSIWDLGPACHDADADGVVESLTRGGDGRVTVYSDSDLDGRVDRITELDPTGDYRVSELDPGTGSWHSGTLGRLE